MFNQPGLKLKKLEIDSDDINIVFIVEGQSVINQINTTIQESSVFKVNINSIENDNQNKIIVNLSVKYKNV
jgi:RNA-binding protein YhbY